MTSQYTPLLESRSLTSQILMGVIGIGLVWVFFGVAMFWFLSYPETPMGLGTALAHTLIPALVTVAGHELAHYIIGLQFFKTENISFVAFEETVGATKGSIGFALVVILLDGFEIVTLPTWVLVVGVVSPGAVLIENVENVRRHSHWVALAGPLYNFGVGMWVRWSVFDGDLVLLGPGHQPWVIVASMAMVLSFVLAFLNALPVGPLDGRQVWTRNHPGSLGLLLMVILGSLWVITSPLF